MSSLRDSTHKKVRQKNRSVENVLITGLLLILASLIRPSPFHQRAAQPPPHHQRERLSRDFKTKKSGRKLDREEKDWRRRRRLKKITALREPPYDLHFWGPCALLVNNTRSVGPCLSQLSNTEFGSRCGSRKRAEAQAWQTRMNLRFERALLEER